MADDPAEILTTVIEACLDRHPTLVRNALESRGWFIARETEDSAITDEVDLGQLRLLAMEATPGPWIWRSGFDADAEDSPDGDYLQGWDGEYGAMSSHVYLQTVEKKPSEWSKYEFAENIFSGGAEEVSRANGRYLEAVSPDVVLKLIEMIEEKP